MPNAAPLPTQEPILSVLATDKDTNADGDINAGWLMAQMDQAGGQYAAELSGGRIITVAVEGMAFLRRVHVKDMVRCYCTTRRVGRTSVTVHIEAWLEYDGSKEPVRITEAAYTFVAIDADGRPRLINGKKA